MWPLILLGLGAGYVIYKKTQPATAAAAPPAVQNAAVMNLPPPSAPAAVYTSPVTQTPSGPTSGIQQNPSPTSQGSPVVHSFLPGAMMAMPTAMMPVSYKLPQDGSGGVAPPAPAPMPSGYTNSKGEFITWTPFEAGSITHDPTTGPWLESQIANQNLQVMFPGKGAITLPSSMIVNLDTAELRM
jgi:hypothetical protein